MHSMTQNWVMLTCTRKIDLVRVAAAMLDTLGLPADISFLPYSWDLCCRGQLPGGFRIFQSAPVDQTRLLADSQPLLHDL